jgi:hypothetical protein
MRTDPMFDYPTNWLLLSFQKGDAKLQQKYIFQNRLKVGVFFQLRLKKTGRFLPGRFFDPWGGTGGDCVNHLTVCRPRIMFAKTLTV